MTVSFIWNVGRKSVYFYSRTGRKQNVKLFYFFNIEMRRQDKRVDQFRLLRTCINVNIGNQIPVHTY